MNITWFKKAGWAYLPVHAMGLIVTLMAVLFFVTVYMAVIRNGHSVYDDLYHMFVYTICTAFW